MSRFKKNVERLIGFTRRERRATLVVTLILLVIIIVRYSSVSHGFDDVIITPLPERRLTEQTSIISQSVLFSFDPNTATREMLTALGLSGRQASTLINYREAGARFDKPADLLKVYGIDTILYARLSPYISIKKEPGSMRVTAKRVTSGIDLPTAVIASGSSLIELNTCTEADLRALPGIGAVLSARIVKYRKLLGGFVNTRQLQEVYGIDTASLNSIYQRIFVNIDSVKMLRMDSCSFKELARHPYIGAETARAIIKYRDIIGPPSGIDVLLKQRVLDSATANRMAPYCLFVNRGTGARDGKF